MENQIYLKSPQNIIISSLKRLINNLPEINAAAIVSSEGLAIASALPPLMDETKLAVVSAVISSISKNVTVEMSLGSFDRVYVKGDFGYLIVFKLSSQALLAISTSKEVNEKLGLIFLECEKVCDEISEFL